MNGRKMVELPRESSRFRPDFSLATVNIVFLLLLFFIVAGTVVTKKEFEVDVAKTENLPLERLPRPLLLINRDNVLFLNGEKLPEEGASRIIKQHFDAGANENPVLHVLVPRDFPAIDLLGRLGELDRLGIDVKVVTKRRAPPDRDGDG